MILYRIRAAGYAGEKASYKLHCSHTTTAIWVSSPIPVLR